MEVTLEKIELVKDRTGVTYQEAKDALEAADGSVVDAIIAIEEKINAGVSGQASNVGSKASALVDAIKENINKGNVSRIKVKKDGEIILNVPVTAGILGVVIAPIASIVGVVAAFGFKCVIEIVREDGTILDVSDAVTDAVGTVAEKGSTVFDQAVGKGAEFYAKGKEAADDLKEKATEAAEDFKERAAEASEDIKAKAAEAASDIKSEIEDKIVEDDEDDKDIEEVEAMTEETSEE